MQDPAAKVKDVGCRITGVCVQVDLKRRQSPLPLPPEEEAYRALDASMVGSEGMAGNPLEDEERAHSGRTPKGRANVVPLLRGLRELPGDGRSDVRTCGFVGRFDYGSDR